MILGVDDIIPSEDDPMPGYDRVVRIVAWVFLMAATVIVAVTGLWPATQPAILVLLALGGLFIVVVHDLLPSLAAGLVALRARGRGRAPRAPRCWSP